MGRTRLSDPDAVVVGSGPNGLAAALTLAREGFKVTVLEAADEPGGGTRTYEDPQVPGLLHDHCSAVHPLAIGSPFLRTLPLERYGLEWCHPELLLAHPFDDGTAATVAQDLATTVELLGPDGRAWERVFGHASRHFDALAEDLTGPVLRVPRHPLVTGRSGPLALLPASVVASWFATERGAALFTGLGAHAITLLSQPFTTGVALLLGAAGHAYGWPVARGGARSIWRAMVALLEELGGEVVTGVEVRSFADIPRTRVALFDTTPTGLAWILGDHLPPRERRRAERWEYGPGVVKIDYAVRGEVPWTASAAHRAGTLHLAGSAEEIAQAEAEVVRGELPARPFVLAAQPHVADPGRAVDGVTPFWAYAHVPHGCTDDVGPLVDAQVERFAPGFTERIVARHVSTPADLEAANPNLVGGDISGGRATVGQLLGRPRLATDPYRTTVPGVWLCSSSTPPGAGVHGMCGHHAARSALRALTA